MSECEAWRWTGNAEEDDIGSMGAEMMVLINARELRSYAAAERKRVLEDAADELDILHGGKTTFTMAEVADRLRSLAAQEADREWIPRTSGRWRGRGSFAMSTTGGLTI